MAITIKVDAQTVSIGLGELRGAVTDPAPLLGIAREIMLASIARTFREEGSPAGSWPKLALSTLKKKSYTSGHKLLILSGRLFRSIGGKVEGDTLTIGTNVVYAGVQFLGSGSLTARVPQRQGVLVKKFKQYGKELRRTSNGREMNVRVRAQGPANATRFTVKSHERRMNIPARNPLVFRPEDPARLVQGFEAYFGGKMARVGAVAGVR